MNTKITDEDFENYMINKAEKSIKNYKNKGKDKDLEDAVWFLNEALKSKKDRENK